MASLWWSAALPAVVALFAGCRSAPPAPPTPAPAPVVVTAPAVTPAAETEQWPGARGTVLGRSDKLLVYQPAAGDSLAAIATRFLARADRAWQIADANMRPGAAPANAGVWYPSPEVPLIVPLGGAALRSPLGVDAGGYQTVPILCYHRLGNGPSKMMVSPSNFEAQMAWLARHHYRVIRLSDLASFLAGRETLPQRAVVISFDDGYESVYRHAFPLLKKYGFAATLFMYSDFVGAGEGLSWAQLQEMATSGLVDIQAHSKTHRNLVERAANESEAAYRQNLETELRAPRQVLERKLAPLGVRVRYFAYPFGDANEWVLEGMRRNDYELGATVNPGGNAFFAHPLMLRRTMIFGDHSLEDFKIRLQIYAPMRKSQARADKRESM
jgi:peptidoglycan/xylan/chitin deacetylase (PgdA/CDA1 family)